MSNATTQNIPAPRGFVPNPCRVCGAPTNPHRLRLGYQTCLPCGEDMAKQERAFWCIAPMHKSNYTLITNPADLLGINNKGGLVK